MPARTVIVSGGAGGVGLAITQRFASEGHRVFVVEREAVRAHLDPHLSDRISFVAADVTDEASVVAAMGQVQQATGRLDVLVNVVGGYAAGQPISELAAATWDHMMNLNLRSAFLMAKHAVPPMIAHDWGRIINFSARAARDTAANAGAYAVSKAGVLALTEVQAKEVLAHNITVNAVLPSIVDTAANRTAMPDADFAHWPKAEEIAGVVAFLASEAAGLISGAGIPVYGRG
ncbi:MAG: SDR family oxidoreductase [Ktedonobacterales bacterium]|nr:SDR family oxidoreductase [Ktedonobacterales bacterium]